MLTQIQTGSPGRPGPKAASLADALQAGDSSDAVELLLGCHQRIRHFTAMAVRLSAPGAPAGQIPAAAQAVYRYYSEALPLHEADENESVYPRLHAAIQTTAGDWDREWEDARRAIADANQAMVDQHAAINRIVAEVLPSWERLQSSPSGAVATADLARQLEQAWTGHLELEEQLIFPALRRLLSAADRQAIRQEMQARRQPRD